jgi:hypothetical protein
MKQLSSPLRALALALSVSCVAPAQANILGATAACGTSAADPASRTPETVVQALYEIVSGPAGSSKDWARLQRLFAPGALVTPTLHDRAGYLAAPQTVEQFSALNQRVFGQRGFFEREIAHQVQYFGHIAHVWSSYETRATADGPVRVRGVNSFQLMNDGARWCLLSATWDSETPEHPIPDHLDRATGAAGG